MLDYRLTYAAHPEVRLRLEELEARTLSKFAARSADASGRRWPQAPDPLRTAYQRDRDRVIHSKAFRRLKHKTQVFIAPKGDHYRTRLTHTMEVTQVARTIARALRLNEDLTEATALAHDLGHTPFGHAGEDAMAEILGHFRHNEQSVRVVEYLERNGRGLNLAEQVKDGILRHSKVREDVAAQGWGVASTLEGQIVKLADSIAYLAHDIDDAIRAGVLTLDQIPREFRTAFGDTTGERIESLVSDIVDYNWHVAVDQGATWQEAVGNGMAISLSPRALELKNGLREFMFKNVYTESAAKEDVPKTKFVIHALFEYFCKHPDELPHEYRNNPRDEPMERRVADWIAGMTDRYAVKTFERIYVPQEWAIFS
ncbi:MAG: deoxyguanosinetriphosphate triphosphohydrolase [Chloroflexota bacterium]|nr:deoxyguanosinetriphosphate triphosphohydrolase [Chloroflexota bacterium]